jgi:hypothetical protein
VKNLFPTKKYFNSGMNDENHSTLLTLFKMGPLMVFFLAKIHTRKKLGNPSASAKIIFIFCCFSRYQDISQ